MPHFFLTTLPFCTFSNPLSEAQQFKDAFEAAQKTNAPLLPKPEESGGASGSKGAPRDKVS